MAFIPEAIKMPSRTDHSGIVGFGLLVSGYIGIKGAQTEAGMQGLFVSRTLIKKGQQH